MFKHPPVITFVDNRLTIRDAEAEGGLVLSYPIARPDFVKSIASDPRVEPILTFSMPQDRLRLMIDVADTMGLPNILLIGTGATVFIGAADAAKPADGTMGGKMPVAESPAVFQLAFKAENWKRVEHRDYRIGIATKGEGEHEGIVHLVSEPDGALQYWIVTLAGLSGPAAKSAR